MKSISSKTKRVKKCKHADSFSLDAPPICSCPRCIRKWKEMLDNLSGFDRFVLSLKRDMSDEEKKLVQLGWDACKERMLSTINKL